MEADQELRWIARTAQLLAEQVFKGPVHSLLQGCVINSPEVGKVVDVTNEYEATEDSTNRQICDDQGPLPNNLEDLDDGRCASTQEFHNYHVPGSITFHGRIFIRSDDEAVACMRNLESLPRSSFLRVYYVHGTAFFDRGSEDLPYYLGVGLAWYSQDHHERPLGEEVWETRQYPIEWRQDQREDRVGLKGLEFALRHALHPRLRDLSNHVTRGKAKVVIFTDCNVEQLRAIEQIGHHEVTELEDLAEVDRTVHGIYRAAKWLYGYATELEIHSVPSMSGGGMVRAQSQARCAARTTREIASELYGRGGLQESPRFVAGNDRLRTVQAA